MKRFGLILTIVALSLFPTPRAQAEEVVSPPFDVSVVLPIAEVNKSYIGTEMTVEGTVMTYTASWKETAPHSLVVKDNTGSLRLVIWPDTWNQIPFRDKLREGAQVTARVLVAEYRGQLQGQIKKASHIVQGLVKPLPTPATSMVGATVTPVVNAPPLKWLTQIPDAIAAAKKERKKILIFFCNTASDNSNYVENKVLDDPRVRAALASGWVTVKCDMQANPELARQLLAFRAGTIGFYKSDGMPLRPHLVPRTADELLEALK